MLVEGCEKNGTIVQCLLKYWLKALDDCDKQEGCGRLRSVFAQGEGAIDVIDEAFGHTIVATNFDEYEEKWEAAAADIEAMTFALSGEPSVRVAGGRAVIKFELTAEGRKVNGAPIVPQPRWRGEHEWRQFDGEWRIVRERLSAL